MSPIDVVEIPPVQEFLAACFSHKNLGLLQFYSAEN
jgi:hypothetical protein